MNMESYTIDNKKYYKLNDIAAHYSEFDNISESHSDIINKYNLDVEYDEFDFFRHTESPMYSQK